MKIKIISAVLVVLLIGLLLPGCSSAQVDELEAQMTELLKSEIEAKDARIIELKDEIETKNKRISELEKEITELQKEIEDLRKSALETAKETEEETAEENAEETAKIEITFDPNPVPCVDGKWHWRVILTEVNGIGVKLNNLIYDLHIVNRTTPNRRTYDSAWFEQWVDLAYLTPYGLESTGFGIPCQDVTHGVITVIGTDDNGHKITAEARVDFQNHYKRS